MGDPDTKPVGESATIRTIAGEPTDGAPVTKFAEAAKVWLCVKDVLASVGEPAVTPVPDRACVWLKAVLAIVGAPDVTPVAVNAWP